jgi:hypothetical protein
MGQRQDKKMRQFFRKEFKTKYEETTEFLAQENAKFLKVKPKWVPMWLWVRCLRIFIKIK